MSYIIENKAAWEAAFENRKPGWGDNVPEELKKQRLAFFNDDMRRELDGLSLKGKAAAQFCCNNGRETLSLMDAGLCRAVGFDIAENIIDQARRNTATAQIENCGFIACNILEIPQDYHNQFDFIFFTIGAIGWFKDLSPLFQKAASCLKDGGRLLINDFHPIMGMLPIPSESAFNKDILNQFAYPYFRKEPWLEENSAGYISQGATGRTFTSFSHTMSDIINSLSENKIRTVKLNEYDYDIGLTDVYDGKGIPLSFILIGEKN